MKKEVFYKNKKTYLMLGLLALVIAVVNSNTILAYAGTAQDALNKINTGNGGVIDSAVSLKFSNIYQDIYGLISMVVIGALSVTTTMTSVNFASAGDNPTAKGALKGKILWQCLGLAFFASSSGIVKFAVANLNMF